MSGSHSERLELARRYLEAGRKLVDQQRALVAKLQGKGLCTEAARHQLDLFEITLKLFEEDYQKIKQKLDARLKKQPLASSRYVERPQRPPRRNARLSHGLSTST
jgi:hypothetical protein